MLDPHPLRTLARRIGEQLAADMIQADRIKRTGAAVKRSGQGAAGEERRQGKVRESADH